MSVRTDQVHVPDRPVPMRHIVGSDKPVSIRIAPRQVTLPRPKESFRA